MPTLEELIKHTKNHQMTDKEKEEQRISFAFGNLAIENPLITREMIEHAALELKNENRG